MYSKSFILCPNFKTPTYLMLKSKLNLVSNILNVFESFSKSGQNSYHLTMMINIDFIHWPLNLILSIINIYRNE